MGHPQLLLNRIQVELEFQYPSSEFDYQFEVALPENPRFRPDIIVWRRSPRELVCIVEIGYTRPEKLVIYQSLGVDCRWYSKEGVLCSGVAMNTSKKPIYNCTVKVQPQHIAWKPELYAPFELLQQLEIVEFTRFVTLWDDEYLTAILKPSEEGRMWGRRPAKRDGPLVGQARMRLKPPNGAIPFQPGIRDDVWLGRAGQDIVLKFSRPFGKATNRAVQALAKRRLQT